MKRILLSIAVVMLVGTGIEVKAAFAKKRALEVAKAAAPVRTDVVEQPKAPVEQPKAPVEQPKAPVEQPKAPVQQKNIPAVQAKQQAITTQLPDEDTIKVYITKMAQSIAQTKENIDAQKYVQNLSSFVSDLATANLAQAKKNEELTAEYLHVKDRAEERIKQAESGPGVIVGNMIEELQAILGKLESFYNEIKDTYMGPTVDSQMKRIRNDIGKLEVHKPISN
jgi:hypothetical protein